MDHAFIGLRPPQLDAHSHWGAMVPMPVYQRCRRWDGAGVTTLLKRSLLSSERQRGERQFAPTCSTPRRRE
jgi:hypothetical protein